LDSKVVQRQIYDNNNKKYCGLEKNDEKFLISGKVFKIKKKF
jgi:hypothetical protein